MAPIDLPDPFHGTGDVDDGVHEPFGSKRAHSPIIERMGKVIILESKSVREYLQQLDGIGENTDEYAEIYGYSMGQSEERMPLFEYPPFDFSITEELTNLDIGDRGAGTTALAPSD